MNEQKYIYIILYKLTINGKICKSFKKKEYRYINRFLIIYNLLNINSLCPSFTAIGRQ